VLAHAIAGVERDLLEAAQMRSQTRDVASSTVPGVVLHVVVVDGDRLVTHPLPPSGTVSIGRGERCDVRLDDPTVSRHHARLHLGPALAIEDLGSANHTYFGEEPLAPNRRRSIAPGDQLRLGSALAVLQWRSPRVPLVPELGSEMQRIHALVERVAPSRLGVLILGETGVGKEVLAERIHRLSPRADRPFLRLHCAALTESLLESELFGHERGAFTGANAASIGLLASAHGGTVFLDEVGELPASTQVKLLQVLEARQVLPVGGVRARAIDVRFVAATNRDLDAEVARASFRQDLYFRLNGISLVVPPLRARLEEIGDLAAAFIASACQDLNHRDKTLSPAALDLLRAHRWPGNIRELRNVIDRAVLLAPGDEIGPEHVMLGTTAGAGKPDDRDAARRRIVDTLEHCGGNQTRAARMLGIGRRTLLERLDELGLPRPRKPTG
jgi:two-component system response regulator AtoC